MAQNRTLALMRVILNLGLRNVARVALYRLAIKTGYYRWRLPIQQAVSGPFLTNDTDAVSAANEEIRYFSAHDIPIKGVPDWFSNPWMQRSHSTQASQKMREQHWSTIADFSPLQGDIKTIWEASRFDWMPKLAWKSIQDDRQSKLKTIETWLRDWVQHNPTNRGINWKCAQEASLRALNLLISVDILRELDTLDSANIAHLLAAHIQRILPTMHYAIAQDNNHGTSEAVALFCIGHYVHHHGTDSERALGRRAMRIGRRRLEERVKKLVMSDGSFSQLSVNYHRLMLDTVCYAEIVRRYHRLPNFSTQFYQRMRAATHWLAAMIDPITGDAANLGANDGAYFANIENRPYRDFRPTLNRGLVLFCDRNITTSSTDALLTTYSIAASHLNSTDPADSQFFPDGGYARLNLPSINGHCLFRYPKYPFRPADCDANHLDIWVGGINLTLDAGSYSYYDSDKKLSEYFAGTSGHCTVRFDQRDQMPKLSRLLRAHWLQPLQYKFDADTATLVSEYRDYLGARHKRTVSATKYELVVEDEFAGFQHQAELLWRLPKLEWLVGEHSVKSPIAKIDFQSSAAFDMEQRIEKNSLKYLELHDIFCVSLRFDQAATVETRFTFNPSS